MTIKLLTILNGIIGGLLLILVYLLGDHFKYIAGLGLAFVYIVEITATAMLAVAVSPRLNLIQQIIVCLIVFLISALISTVYIFATNRNIGNVKENIEAFLILLLIGTVLSLIIPTIVSMFRMTLKK